MSALRSRSGVHRQAIHGLTLDASASCLASRETRASPRRSGFAMLGATRRGEGQQPRNKSGTAKGGRRYAPPASKELDTVAGQPDFSRDEDQSRHVFTMRDMRDSFLVLSRMVAK